MSRTDPQFNLRIPHELRDRVMEAAQANKRSATAEILARLEASFADTSEPRITTRIRREALSGEDLESSLPLQLIKATDALRKQLAVVEEISEKLKAEKE
ncbi:Arc family DNA-binding protein [Pseudomonas linyingensis]|uniref:Arc family DNA-binding protein n=1 Tax=Pseudomonas linyingensis TaxID=915471 RepID=UPI000B801E98|nr:Arc family DNA-binding protein [Pseudomonas linyingensis]